MQLSRKSRTVRWAYLFESKPYVGKRTSLCLIFWRCVLFTPLKFAFIGICAAPFVAIAVMAYDDPGPALFSLGIVAALAALAGLVFYIAEQPRLPSPIKEHPLFQGAVAVKNKVCPIVEID